MALTNEGGVFGILNQILEHGPAFLARGLNKALEVTGSAIGGVSELASNIGDRASLSFGAGAEAEVGAQKLGRSADLHMGRIAPPDLDVVVPAVPMNVSQSLGMGF